MNSSRWPGDPPLEFRTPGVLLVHALSSSERAGAEATGVAALAVVGLVLTAGSLAAAGRLSPDATCVAIAAGVPSVLLTAFITLRLIVRPFQRRRCRAAMESANASGSALQIHWAAYNLAHAEGRHAWFSGAPNVRAWKEALAGAGRELPRVVAVVGRGVDPLPSSLPRLSAEDLLREKDCSLNASFLAMHGEKLLGSVGVWTTLVAILAWQQGAVAVAIAVLVAAAALFTVFVVLPAMGRAIFLFQTTIVSAGRVAWRDRRGLHEMKNTEGMLLLQTYPVRRGSGAVEWNCLRLRFHGVDRTSPHLYFKIAGRQSLPTVLALWLAPGPFSSPPETDV